MAQKVSQDTLARYVKAGYGLGRMDTYKPWLRIRRGFSSPVSKQVFCNLTLRTTNHHLLSGLEYKTALLNSWLGPTELRECLPLWLNAHPHPQSGIDNEAHRNLNESPGLLEIAKTAGIDPGVFPGTKIHYIASCDLVFWIPLALPIEQQLLYISCKPTAELRKHERVRERVELDRRYALANGGTHIVETGDKLPLMLIDNLDVVIPLRTEVLLLRDTTKHRDFCRMLMGLSTNLPLGAAIELTRISLGISRPEGFLYFRVGVWLHRIDIDLNHPVVMSWPMLHDGGKTLSRWRNHYWPSSRSKNEAR